jgi:hypothetical protein
MWFLCSSANWNRNVKKRYNCFLSHPFQFIITFNVKLLSQCESPSSVPRTDHCSEFIDYRFAWMFMLSYSSSILVCSTRTWNWRSRNAATLSGSQNVLLRNIEPRLTITFPSSEPILIPWNMPHWQLVGSGGDFQWAVIWNVIALVIPVISTTEQGRENLETAESCHCHLDMTVGLPCSESAFQYYWNLVHGKNM